MAERFSTEGFSDEKVLAAQLLANKDANGLSDADIARECACSERTLYRWKTDPDFIELLNHYAELAQDAFVPELYASLRKQVRNGNTRAAELVLKNRGKLIDRKEVSGSLEVTAKAESLTEDALKAEILELKRKVGKLAGDTPKALPEQIIDAELTTKRSDDA